MDNELVFDVETAPDAKEEMIAEACSNIEYTKAILDRAEKEKKKVVKSGSTDEEAELVYNFVLERYVQSKKQDIISDFALSPMTGKILGIGCYGLDGSKTYKEDSELENIIWFNGVLNLRHPKIISFNGKSFDAHFIKVRSAILGYNFDYQIDTRKYDTKNHFDVREVLTNFGANPKGTLRQWAIAFGFEPPKDTGENIHLLSKEERSTKCLQDCEITYEIYKKLKPLF